MVAGAGTPEEGCVGLRLAGLMIAALLASQAVAVEETVRHGYQAAVALKSGSRIVCSGVLVGPADVLTAAHCVPFSDSVSAVLATSGREVRALKRSAFRPEWDLAMLLLSEPLCCHVQLLAGVLLPGRMVYFWGAPAGSFPILAMGYVSVVEEGQWSGDRYGHARHEMVLIGGSNLLSGSSGGGWFAYGGQLAGLHVRGLRDELSLPLGWAIAVGPSTLAEFLRVQR